MESEMKSPAPCPSTVTIRRNPHRRARATPSSAIRLREPLSSPSPLPRRDIFSTKTPQNPKPNDKINTTSTTEDPPSKAPSENLKVFLRIRPASIQKITKCAADSKKNAWPRNPRPKPNSRPAAKTSRSGEMCVQVNDDLRSVTVATPQSLQETKRIKSEVYEGFSRVFAPEASQSDVYEEMVKPLVEDFLKGKSGMLAAMGPSGSGKTHTVFGTAREPGMVPLALRRVFSGNAKAESHLPRVFYLSMFEISSEKGKAEGMIDLLHDGGDVCMQHNSVIKGLHEAVVHDAQQAESLIARGMLKRATAMTNSNSQSSRSQCIINIRCDSEKGNGELDGKSSSTMLTIVDLAGAEREKKTGNQGARLLESNFINNTSMVFGLCLRSLLEHQKNRNKPLQKHYKNSLLTRYMRDYMEGKKRMMLILTIKPGVEDYLDTSFLLRQASPFTKISFKSLEEPMNWTSNKRPNQALPWVDQIKKMKFSKSESSLVDDGNIDKVFQITGRDDAGKVVNDGLHQNIEVFEDENLNDIHVRSEGFVGLGVLENSSLKGDYANYAAEKDREYKIMQGVSKAIWKVLKQYKRRLEGIESENAHLKDSLKMEKMRSQDLENELANEKMRFFDLENVFKELHSCTCSRKPSADEFPVSSHDSSSDLSQSQAAVSNEEKSEIYLNHNCEQDAVNNVGYAKNLELESECVSKELCLTNCVIFERANTSQDQPPENSEDLNSTGDAKNLDIEGESVSNGSCLATSFECGSANCSQDYEDLNDAKEEALQLENKATDDSLSVVEDRIVPVVAHLHTAVSSSESPRKEDLCPKVDDEEVNREEGKLNAPTSSPPKEKLDDQSMSKFSPALASRGNFPHAEKPRRRLQPAKSVLLKDLAILDVKDETDKPKGVRGGKKMPVDDEKKRTKGSLSLLNLLTS